MTAPFTQGVQAFAPAYAQAAQLAVNGISAFQSNLRAWRSMMDSMRISIRKQQDMALRAMRAQATDAAHPHAEGEDGMLGPMDFLSPMIAAQKVYEQMGDAVLEAQKEAFEALANGPKPH
jgi:hypothetical protein